MPIVKTWRPATYEERQYWGTAEHYDYERKPWKELTRKQMTKAAMIRASAILAAGGSLFISWPNGPVDSWGDSPRAAKRVFQRHNARLPRAKHPQS